MLYKLSGFPEEDEIVLCKVTKIFPNSVFVNILEYNKQGMVHISEVSPGRIRNLRDYVSIGRQIVCKVLKINLERGHIDLSLRRVNSSQRREKLDEIKQELKAENIVKNLAKKLKKNVDELYKSISQEVFKEYSHLYLCFRDVADEETNFESLSIEKNIAQELSQVIKEKFKPQKIILRREMNIQTYAGDGVEKIKTLLNEIEKLSPTITLLYLGAGRYRITIEEQDYKSAKKKIQLIQKRLEKFEDKLSSAILKEENKK